MLRVRYAFLFVACLALLALACLPLLAGVRSPASRSTAQSGNAVTLSGYTKSHTDPITIKAVDQNTGDLSPSLGTATIANSGTTYSPPSGSYTLYKWTFDAHVLASHFWAPQSLFPDLKTSQGHLEIVASADGNKLRTFSADALKSFENAPNFTTDPAAAAAKYSDGDSTVLFDQYGVGSGPETPWVTVNGMISPSPEPNVYSSVAWSVGYYTVEGGKKIYALICAPTTSGQYPVVIYNHGGIEALGDLHGHVTSSGWTSAPSPAGASDDLGQCLDWAKRGWIFAVSSYRGESITITAAAGSGFQPPASPWVSDSAGELCMGEVTDVMALTNLLVHHTSAIELGSTTEKVKINAFNGKVFMYGWSHGGCITYRAVEQGAPVDAFAVIEGFTDFSLNYLNYTNLNQTPQQAAQAAGACKPITCPLVGSSYYYPDASGVMGYNWRSAHYFASRGDLSIQKFKTMPIMIFHGDINFGNPVFLDEPVEIADDIKATKIFVGPSPPTNVNCINGTVGKAVVDPTTHEPLVPLASCQVTFMAMDATDPCVSGATVPALMTTCTVLQLPLTPSPGEPQQLHYLVVYHNMNHTNGGLAIKNQFDRFAEQNFRRQPGCDGVLTVCNN